MTKRRLLQTVLRAMVGGLTVCLLGMAARAHAAVDAYDFDFRISGDTSARPVQVFGDAERTYFQFPPGRPIPLILAGPAAERVVPMAEGPYHVVAGRSAEYTLRLAGRQARVEHAGRVWKAVPPRPSPDAPTSPPAKRGADDRTLSSYATPVRGDVIEWVEPERRVEHRLTFPPGSPRLSKAHTDLIAKVSSRLGPDVDVELHGAASARRRGLSESRLHRVTEALVRAGVPAERIEPMASNDRSTAVDTLRIVWRAAGPRPTASGVPEPATGPETSAMGRPLRGNFDILLSDGTLSTSLRRWAHESGYRLEWDTPIEAPVVGDLTLDTRRFPEAVERIVTGLRASGYPLRLETEEGRLVRIRHDPPP